MKTYDEMAQSALTRIRQYEVQQKKRRKAAVRIAVPAACFCLVAAIGVGAWQAGLFGGTPAVYEPEPSVAPVPYPDGTIRREQIPETMPEHPILRPGDEGYIAPEPTPGVDAVDIAAAPDTDSASTPAVPPGTQLMIDPMEPEFAGSETQKGGGADVTGGFCEFWWKNKLRMFGDLYWAIDENPGGTFSVLATYRPATANITDFVYEGKTLAEWAIEADNERILPDKMQELLKQGDELKYGTALYETGTPEGYKWDRRLYEDRVAWFGELLDKYIVDGEFLRDTLEKDIAALDSVNVTTPDGTTTVTYIGETAARKQYALAWQAYLDAALPAAAAKLTASGIPCERVKTRTDALCFTATAAQLEALPLDDPGSWALSLNSGDLKAADN